jgi:DNA-binding transcriptional MerR regulator
MLTISQLARRFGLSRSTLLYYDSIGLLSPSERSRANYRLYSPADVERMELIDVYRRAGLSLAEIARVLATDGDGLDAVLAGRLRSLEEEIRKLRRQQTLIAKLAHGPGLTSRARPMDKRTWVSILEATGLSRDDMHRWHVEFERLSPEAHQDFLASLGIDENEIARIRKGAREGVDAAD